MEKILLITLLLVLTGCQQKVTKPVVANVPVSRNENTKVEYLPSKPGETTVKIYATPGRMSFWDYFVPPALANDATVYSGTGDGEVVNSLNTTWAAIHDASVGVSYNYDRGYYVVGVGTNIFTGYQYIDRGLIPFDTSVLPGDAVVTAASITLNITVKINGPADGHSYIGLTTSTQASSNSIILEDFNKVGATSSPAMMANTITIADMATTTPLVFTLNATGRGEIKPSGATSKCGKIAGVSCFGLREGHDIDNVDVGSTIYSVVAFQSAEATYGQPYLTITYYASGATGKFRLDSGTMQIKSGSFQLKD